MTQMHDDLREHYLELLARMLAGLVHPGGPDYRPLFPAPSWVDESTGEVEALEGLQEALKSVGQRRPDHWVEIRRAVEIPKALYISGESVNTRAFTMIGLPRLRAIRDALLDTHRVSSEDSAGDYVEVGVWRGGSGIFAAEVCRWYGLDAQVFLYDTFAGFPTEAAYSPDFGDVHDQDFVPFVAPISDVRANFAQLSIPIRNVHFVEGDVESTSQLHPDRPIAVLRLDVDLYRPTYAALENFWPNVVPGGCVIVDDWNYCVDKHGGRWFPAQQATLDFASAYNLSMDSLAEIDHMAVSFRK